MIVETSALLAILLEEAEAESFALLIRSAPIKKMSVANYLEASIVAKFKYGVASAYKDIDDLISVLSITLAPVTTTQGSLARDAFDKYRKGKKGLNFGDCFAYALAKEANEPLLFKGDDFSKTDIVSAG